MKKNRRTRSRKRRLNHKIMNKKEGRRKRTKGTKIRKKKQ
jgi:hypothetical protein